MKNSKLTRRKFITLASGSALGLSIPSVFAKNVITRLPFDEMTWKPYENSIVIDGLSAAFDHGVEYIDTTMLTLFRNSGITALNATIPYPGDDFSATNQKIAATKALINKYSDHLNLVTTANDILRTKKQNKLGIIMGFQSTEMIDNDLSRIKYYADSGVKYMQLTYNRKSQFGDGGLENPDRGLTELGRKAIAHMEENNVLVDLSHSGTKTVTQAIQASKKPLTISHTGCNGIYFHPRNNDDTVLKSVANKGGVVGIYLMPFLTGGDSEITANNVMKHIDYALNLCGEDHVSIGSDQGIAPIEDGPEYREMIRKEVERRIAAGISAPGETPNKPPFVPELNQENRMELIAYHMKRRGHSQRVIEKVLGKNLLNLYQNVW